MQNATAFFCISFSCTWSCHSSETMTAEQLSQNYPVEEFFNKIDMGFLNRRLALTALGPMWGEFIQWQKPPQTASLGSRY